MKNFFSQFNKAGLLALALVATATVAFKPAPLKKHGKQADLHWYPVNTAGTQTTGAAQYFAEKQDVIDDQSCKDIAGSVCWLGSTNASLATGSPVGSPDEQNRILRND